MRATSEDEGRSSDDEAVCSSADALAKATGEKTPSRLRKRVCAAWSSTRDWGTCFWALGKGVFLPSINWISSLIFSAMGDIASQPIAPAVPFSLCAERPRVTSPGELVELSCSN